MPIYEYQCESCEHELEAIQKFSDAPLTECPACHSDQLKKKVSAAAFRLSGSGWYETDFKSGEKKNLVGDKSSDSGSKTESKAEKASDSGSKPGGEKKKTTPKSDNA